MAAFDVTGLSVVTFITAFAWYRIVPPPMKRNANLAFPQPGRPVELLFPTRGAKRGLRVRVVLTFLLYNVIVHM
jgi:hypothetical protein